MKKTAKPTYEYHKLPGKESYVIQLNRDNIVLEVEKDVFEFNISLVYTMEKGGRTGNAYLHNRDHFATVEKAAKSAYKNTISFSNLDCNFGKINSGGALSEQPYLSKGIGEKPAKYDFSGFDFIPKDDIFSNNVLRKDKLESSEFKMPLGKLTILEHLNTASQTTVGSEIECWNNGLLSEKTPKSCDTIKTLKTMSELEALINTPESGSETNPKIPEKEEKKNYDLGTKNPDKKGE